MVEYLGGRFGQAIAHYDKARSLTPEQVLWPLVMAQTAASGGDHERVRDIVRRWAVPPASHPLAALPHMLKEATLGERTLLDRTMSRPAGHWTRMRLDSVAYDIGLRAEDFSERRMRTPLSEWLR